MIQKIVSRIHFSDFGSVEFERLCFAFICRLKKWDSIEWIGQVGSDGGRDIWGEIGTDTFCYQCANHKTLPAKKVTDDIDKLVKGKTIPNNFIVISGGVINPSTRTTIIDYARLKGIKKTSIWSGTEFEEKLRTEAPELIERFVHGDKFPETSKDLREFSKNALINRDADIISAILQNLNRPAFTTRFRSETSLPNFEKALEDTIILLNTGVLRLRDGTLLGKYPSRHQVKDENLKSNLQDLTNLVVHLRDTYLRLKSSNEIRDCGCSDANCSTIIVTDNAADQIDDIRSDIFKLIAKLDPSTKTGFSQY